MAYDRKLFIGGTLKIATSALGGNPILDSYTFEQEHGGVIYQWTGVRAQTIDKEGYATFELPPQQTHADGGPYTMQCAGIPLAWDNP